MMKVVFIRSYRGWATGERFYQKGEAATLKDDVAKYLIAQGRAEKALAKPKRKRR